MTVISIQVEMVFEILVKKLEELEIRGRIETLETTALLRSATILRRELEIERITVTQTSKLVCKHRKK